MSYFELSEEKLPARLVQPLPSLNKVQNHLRLLSVPPSAYTTTESPFTVPLGLQGQKSLV